MRLGLFARISVLSIIVLVPLQANAQTTTGSIDGRVSDPNGEPLPGVTVVVNSSALIQPDLTAFANDEGYYRLTLLPPGTYEVTFQVDGFRPLQRSALLVQVGKNTVVDADLELAAVTEMAIVVGEVPSIDPRQAKLGFTYSSDLAENIPTARNMSALFSTVPGVESVNNSGAGIQPGTYEQQNVLGSGERSSSYMLDGMNTTNPAGQWNTQSLMPYDGVQEVQILTAAKPAEVPFQGGLFNVITKSGGNDFSGTLGGYYANDSLQSSNAGGFEGVNITNELVREYELTASLGGRILQDELWWYGSGLLFDGTTTLYGFPADVSEQIKSASGKLTWQAGANHRLTATASLWDQKVSHFFYGYSPALALDEQASAYRPLDGRSAGVQWSGILSDSLVAEANVNYTENDFDQQMQPGGDSAIVDLVTGRRSRSSGTNPGNIRDQDTDFWNARASLSWFVPDAAGQHDVKFGVEYMPTRSQIGFDEAGDHQLHTIFGRKFAVRLLNTPTTAIWDNDLTALYAQDSWAVSDRLTLDIGVRYMHSYASSPEQAAGGGRWANTALVDRFPEMAYETLAPLDLVTWDTFEPRLAGTYQLGDSGSTILRFGAARYYQNLDSYKFFVATPAFPNTWVTRWDDKNGDFAYQVGEEGALLFSFGGALNSIDPNLRRPYTDELVFGVSHEFAGDLQLSANGILRRDRDLTATEDIGDVRYNLVDVNDPGRDGIIGTGDDATLAVYDQDPETIGNSRLEISNPDGAERDYKALEVTASKRFTGNWQAVASLVWSEMKTSLSTMAQGDLGVFASPNGIINARGLDEANQTVQVKLQGTYRFGFGLGVSGLYRFRTGTPYTRELVVTGLSQGPFNVRAEPRGSSTTDGVSTLDLRLEHSLELPTGRLGLMIDGFNLMNSSPATDKGRITGTDYSDTLSVMAPRVLRFGARFTW